MNSLIKLDYAGSPVRIVDRDGGLWFVAKDIAEQLGYTRLANVSNIIKNIPDEWKGLNPIKTFQGEQNALIVSEQGLWFWLGRCDKPAALPFRKWVAGEVIPSIRKTGTYSIQQPKEQQPTADDALILAGYELLMTKVRQQTQELEQKTQALAVTQQALTEAKPLVEFAKAVTSSDDVLSLREVAKIINIPHVGQNNLFRLLKDNKVLMRSNEPYQRYVDMGWFKVITTYYTTPKGNVHVNKKTMVYQKGVDGIRRILLSRKQE